MLPPSLSLSNMIFVNLILVGSSQVGGLSVVRISANNSHQRALIGLSTTCTKIAGFIISPEVMLWRPRRRQYRGHSSPATQH